MSLLFRIRYQTRAIIRFIDSVCIYIYIYIKIDKTSVQYLNIVFKSYPIKIMLHTISIGLE